MRLPVLSSSLPDWADQGFIVQTQHPRITVCDLQPAVSSACLAISEGVLDAMASNSGRRPWRALRAGALIATLPLATRWHLAVCTKPVVV